MALDNVAFGLSLFALLLSAFAFFKVRRRR